MATSLFDGNVHVTGTLTANVLAPTTGTVTSDMIVAGVTQQGLAATKLEQMRSITYAQPIDSVTIDQTVVLTLIYGVAGAVVSVRAGSITPCTGNATVDIDVLKDGTTILSAAIALNNAGVAYTPKSGVIAVSAIAAGDVLTVDISPTVGTGVIATGIYINVVYTEDGI
ncbi:hypothetical protein LCGC14_3158430, partial [marine sediment metagenome]